MSQRPMPRPRRAVPHALTEVASHLGIPWGGIPGGSIPLREPDPAEVTGLTLDSRDVRPGDLYAALPGSRTHGAQHARDAAERGAVAVLTDPAGERPARDAGRPVLVVPDPRARLGALAAWLYGDPGAGLLLVAVTGTNGKTTTAHLLDAVLREAGHRTGLVGTVETRVGDRVLPSVRTTPEAPQLQALLAVMREEGATAATVEVSSHALVLGRVDGAVFDVAAFTNLSQDHLDFHGGMAEYFAAKASLFTPERARYGVVCVDDEYGQRLAATASVPVTTVATADADADWRATVDGAEAGAPVLLRHRDGTEVRATSPLPGRVNAANAALAAVVGLVAGATPEQVERALAGAGGVPGRMERVRVAWAGAPLALVDYAHTPHAVEAAAGVVRASVPGRVVVVLGAGGDRDPRKRAPMGAAAMRSADLVVVTDDNPRSEEPAAIRAAVRSGAQAAGGPGRVVEVAHRGAAIRAAVRGLGPGDAVLVAGKGHEPGQEVDGVVHPFDDRTVLRDALEAEARSRERT